MALATTGAAVPGESDWVLIPVGRSAVDGPNSFDVEADGVALSLQPISDGCGGYWVRMPDGLPAETSVVVRFSVTEGHDPGGYAGEYDERWLASSRFIDSDAPSVAAAAASIAPHGSPAVERALALHTYVADELEWQYYQDYMRDPASRTLELGYGTCANSARLFVALCRAAKIPARTVRGVAHDGETFDTYHEWAEFQDNGGTWHPLEPLCAGSLDLEGVTSLDLMYAAEENPFLAQGSGGGGDTDVGITVLYDALAIRGRLGFQIVSHTSDAFVLENTYEIPASTAG